MSYREFDDDKDGREREQEMNTCIQRSIYKGAKWAAISTVGATAATFGLNKYNTWFRKSLGISGKTASVVCCMAGAFFLCAELEMSKCRQELGFRRVGLVDKDGNPVY